MRRFNIVTACSRLLVVLLGVSGAGCAQSLYSISPGVAYGNGQFTYTYKVTATGDSDLWLIMIKLNTAQLPGAIVSPPGWKSKAVVDAGSAYIVWYTEGPGGISSGDYGADVIRAPQSLSNFGYVSNKGPGEGVSFATSVNGSGDLLPDLDVESDCTTSLRKSPGRMIFGPVRFMRAQGPPDDLTQVFSNPFPTASYKLVVANGNADSSGRVDSAQVLLNGSVLLTPNDLNPGVANLEVPVTLKDQNTLEVRLASKPGSLLTLSIQTISGCWWN